MIFQVSNIIRDVRIALDLNKVSTALEEIGDVDTLSLNDIIQSKIVEAVKRVHSTAPVYLLDHSNSSDIGGEVEEQNGTTFINNGITWNDDHSGYILLPDNFMRFIVFQMSDWERPVYSVIDAINDPNYALQSSRIAALKGTPQRPKCAITIRNQGRALEFYTCKSEEATIKIASYMPYPSIESNAIDICKRCYSAVVYTIASLTSITLGYADKASAYNELAQSALV